MSEILYAVKMRYGLAVNDGGYAVFFRKRDAVAFRNKLAPHIGYKGKIVRVRIET